MAARERIGLDIGFSSIKVVVLSEDKTPKLISLGQIASPQPGIISDSDLDLEAIGTAIKNLLHEVGVSSDNVVIALPESKIFTRVIYDLPFLTNDELSQAIKYAAEEFVPLPIEQVNLNYQVIFRSAQKGPDSRTVVFVVATPKTLVEKYLKVLNMAQIKALAIETELIAAARALLGSNPYSPPTLIVQFGSATTDFAVFADNLVLLTRSISTGSVALTRTIAQSFNFDLTQAEEYKKVYGILSDQLEGKQYSILKPIMDVIVTETKRVIQSQEIQNPQRPIKRVVLTGGGAKLPGLVVFMADSLGLEVQEADPWVSIEKDPKVKQKLLTDAPLYTVAVGLALREEK